MKNLFVFITVLTIICVSVNASHSAEYWAKSYKENTRSGANSIHQTSDGGYIVAGATTFDPANSDFWVLKLDVNGDISWQKTYGGSGRDPAYSIQQTMDGGYIVAGAPLSFRNYWVLKLDSAGDIEWQKTYEGNGAAYSIQQTSDGGYVVAGYIVAWYGRVIKLDSNGEVMWVTQLVGAKFKSIQQTLDGGYIVAGLTASFGAGSNDFLVLKLDSGGTVSWQKTYGGSASDVPQSIQQTVDGGYIVAGHSESFGAGEDDAWALKLDSAGNVEWQKTYGGNLNEGVSAIQQITDGGYIMVGFTSSFGVGSYDFWVIKLDGAGKVSWQKTYGSGGSDKLASIDTLSSGGYIVAGASSSFGGGYKSWVLKLDCNGDIPDCDIISVSDAVVTDTSVIGQDINATIVSPSLTITDTNITPQDSSAEITTICEGGVEDSDCDGIPDDVDDCPDSSLEGTIIIDGCNSGVNNHLFGDGCKISDLIAECAEGAKNHGKFVSCVSHLTNDWKKQKLISGKDKGAIQNCAAQADIP